jgi:translation initiation factor RLI1
VTSNALGQQATTLSGGEAQRVKLASELHKRSTGRSIYIHVCSLRLILGIFSKK